MDTIPAKTILLRNRDTFWFGSEYNMNLYRGCCHGCVYCDSRSDCYQVGDFENVRAKADALRILRDELARKVKRGVAATGAMSDPYNPHEKTEELTRGALALLDTYSFGAAVATKSDLIVRDIDILKDIAAHDPVLCKITVTTCRADLAAKLEPAAPRPARRMEALEKLAAAGLFTGVLLMPVLPWLEDSDENVLEVVERAAAAGARFVYPMFGVTLRSGQREHMLAELEKAFGQSVAAKYRRFGERYHCASPRAKQLWQCFTKACQARGLLYEMRDIVAASRQGYGSRQLSFL